MCVPDMALIVEIMLMSEGFNMSKMLSRKFVILYRLCEDLLSKSKHYDWKLRAIKTTLYVAGGMKRSAPDLSEDKANPCFTSDLLCITECISAWQATCLTQTAECHPLVTWRGLHVTGMHDVAPMKSVCTQCNRKESGNASAMWHDIKRGCCSGVVASSEGLQPGQADSR